MCLCLAFVSIFDFLCVVGGAGRAYCNLSWPHAVVVLARDRSCHLRPVVGAPASMVLMCFSQGVLSPVTLHHSMNTFTR